MNAVMDMVDEAKAMSGASGEAVRPYSTRSWGELRRMNLPPPEIVWGGFALGAVGLIFGPGGIGKSIASLNIAFHQVLGLPFASMPTAARPLRHLIMGSENSMHRLKDDSDRMSAGLPESKLELLDDHIVLSSLEDPEDVFISLSSEENIRKWAATLERFKPDVLWVDPWGDVLDGDGNSDEDVRATLCRLRRLLLHANPQAALIVLAHSRYGAKNYAQAAGYDAGNFGKGSKALFSAARCVWHLAPGDETETPPIIWVNAKCNDSPKQKPFAMRLHAETRLFMPVTEFDLGAWQTDVTLRANGKSPASRLARISEDDASQALGDNTGTKTEVEMLLRDNLNATRTEAKLRISQLLRSGRWTEWKEPKKNGATYIGPPAAIERRKNDAKEQKQDAPG